MPRSSSLPALRGVAAACALFASLAVKAAGTLPTPDAAAHAALYGQLVTHVSRTRPVRVKNDAELHKMRAFLDLQHPHAPVKHSFHLASGDEIECVDIHQQPTLRRADMKGHRLLSPPRGLTAARLLRAVGKPGKAPAGKLRFTPASGMFLRGERDQNGKPRKCPAGSVPIKKPSIDELKSFATLGDYHAKYPSHAAVVKRFSALRPGAHGTPAPLAGPAHDHAGASHDGLKNYGASANINVWKPFVGPGNEFSLSQIWVLAGDWADNSLQSLEVGVITDPSHHTDGQPRLFVYSTSDAYQHHEDPNPTLAHASGCYNLHCARFVQTDPGISFDAPITSVSTPAGTQLELEVAFVKHQQAWWLWVQGHWVGYYPTSLYSQKGLLDHSTLIDFGGEIVDDPAGHAGQHTQTAMGSGAWPAGAFGNAAFQRRIAYFAQPSGQGHYWATSLSGHAEKPNCYNVGSVNYTNSDWGTYFFFGGPGRSTQCP